MIIASVGRYHFFEQTRALAALGAPVQHFCDDPRVLKLGSRRGVWLPGLMLEFRYWAGHDKLRAYRLAADRLRRAVAGRPAVRLNAGFAWESLQCGIPAVVDHGSLHESHMRAVLTEEAHAWGEPLIAKGGNHDLEWLVERQSREFECARRVVVASELAKQTLVAEGVSSAKIRVAPLGVDLARFRPYPGADNGRRVLRILHAGPLTFTKGVHRLIRAFRQSRLANAELWLVGRFDNDLAENWLRRQAHGSNVRFLPPVPQRDLPRLFSSVDAFVLASLGDGFGLTVLQAMACDLPIVLSRKAGCAELLEGCAGVRLLGMPNDAELVDAIRQMPELVRSHSRGSIRQWASRLDWTHHAESLLRALEDDK